MREEYSAEFEVDKRSKVWKPVWLDILDLHHQLDEEGFDVLWLMYYDDGKDDGTRTRVNEAPLMSALNLYQISL